MANYWWKNSLADNDANNPSNYNTQENGGGSTPGSLTTADNLYYSNTASSANATMSAALAVNHFYFDNAQTGGTDDYTGTFDCNDYNLTLYGSFIDSAASTILGGSGTIKFSASGAVSWIINGAFTKETCTIEFATTSTVTITGNAASLNNVTFNNSSCSVTLNDTVTVTGTATLTAFNQITKGTGTGVWELKGNVTSSAATTASSMTGIFRISGSADQTLTASGGVRIFPKVEINSTGGTVYLVGSIETRGGWLYTAGTVNTGTSTYIHGSAYTFTDSTTSWYKYNIGVSAIDFNGSTIIVTNTFQVNSGVGAANLNGGTIKCRGDIILLAAAFYNYGGAIQADGTGSQTIGASGGSSSIGYFTVNKASGTLTIQDTIQAYYDWTWTQGTVDPGTSTIRLANMTISWGTQSLYKVDFYRPAGGGTATVTGTLKVTNEIRFTDIAIVNGGTIEFQGNLVSTDTAITGTCAMTATGTGTQNINMNGGTGRICDGTILINKASGTVILTNGGLTLDGVGQDLVLQAGTLDLNGYNLTVNDQFQRSAGTTVRIKGSETVTAASRTRGGTVEFYDLAVTAQPHLYDTTWTDFSVPNGVKTFQWQAGTTFLWQGALTLNSTSANRTLFRSTSGGSHWNLNYTGTIAGNVDSLDVQDSDASYGNLVYVVGSTDSGNNHNWKFLADTATGQGSVAGIKASADANATSTGAAKVPGIKADGFAEYTATGAAKTPGVKADADAAATSTGSAKVPGVKADANANTSATGAAKVPGITVWGSSYTQAWGDTKIPGVKGAATATTSATGASKTPGVKSSGSAEARGVGAVKVPGVSANGQAAATVTGNAKVPGIKASGAAQATATAPVKVPGVRGHAHANAEGTGSAKVPGIKSAAYGIVTATGVVKVPGIRGHGLGTATATGSAKVPSLKASATAIHTSVGQGKVPGIRSEAYAVGAVSDNVHRDPFDAPLLSTFQLVSELRF